MKSSFSESSGPQQSLLHKMSGCRDPGGTSRWHSRGGVIDSPQPLPAPTGGATQPMLWVPKARYAETRRSPCTGAGPRRCRRGHLPVHLLCPHHAPCPSKDQPAGQRCWQSPPRPRPRERPVPTSQGFLQGLGEAGPAGAVAVIPAGVLPRQEGQGRQVKVHQSEVMTSHLDRRRQSNRDGLRCFYSQIP